MRTHVNKPSFHMSSDEKNPTLYIQIDCRCQMLLALPSLLMEIVCSMSLELIISSRRLSWKNVVFLMRLSPSWVLKVVVRFNERKSFLLLFDPCFGLILVEFSGKSTLLNHLFGTNFREMDAFRGRHFLKHNVTLITFSFPPKMMYH